MDAFGVLVGESTDKHARQVLVEEQLSRRRGKSMLTHRSERQRCTNMVNRQLREVGNDLTVVIPDARYSNTS